MKCYVCHNESDNYPIIFSVNPTSYTLTSEFTGEITESTSVICDKCYIPFLLRKKYRCDLCGLYCNRLSDIHHDTIQVRYTGPFFEHMNGIWKINLDKVGCALDNVKGICNECLPTVIKKYDCTILPDKIVTRGNCCICAQNVCRKECQINDDYFTSYAQIFRRNIFGYGSDGLFHIVGDDIPFSEGSICNICLAKYRYRKYTEAECTVCYKNYQSTNIFMNEGKYCCSIINDDCISIGTDSTFRSNIMFTNIKPEYLKYNSVICDDCIQKLIDKKVCKKYKKQRETYYEEKDCKMPGTLVSVLIKSANKR